MVVNNCAAELHALGEYEEARRLHEDILSRTRRVLGKDHPNTIIAAHNLAEDLHALGKYEQARRHREIVLTYCRRVLGEDHPDTITAASKIPAALPESDK